MIAMEEYPAHLDYVWIAIDRNGHVGLFITAGTGPIPKTAIDNELLEFDLESKVLIMAPVSNYEFVMNVPSPESFIELAKRGFFVFDWQNAHRPRSAYIAGYDRVAVPTQPVSVVELPPTLRTIAAHTCFINSEFSRDAAIDVQQETMCLCSNVS